MIGEVVRLRRARRLALAGFALWTILSTLSLPAQKQGIDLFPFFSWSLYSTVPLERSVLRLKAVVAADRQVAFPVSNDVGTLHHHRALSLLAAAHARKDERAVAKWWRRLRHLHLDEGALALKQLRQLILIRVDSGGEESTVATWRQPGSVR